MVAQIYAPFGQPSYESRSDITLRVDPERFCYRNASRRSTSAWASENDATWNEARAVPPMGGTGDKSHTPS